MEMPVLGFPEYVEELCKDFEHLFRQKRQMLQFKRLVSGFAIANKHTIAHMNGQFVYHTNQSNLNRFLRSKWDIGEMNRIKADLINRVEDEGVVVIDDYIVEKYGKDMYGVDYHYDHSKKRNVWGLQIADCVLSGDGIYPLLSTVYVRKDSRWEKEKRFRTKIEIQMEHLTQLCEMGLKFSCVVMDIWYFNRELTSHIERLGRDWVAECKPNRLVLSDGRWIPLSRFAKEKISKGGFRVVEIGRERYMMRSFTLFMKNMGRVRVLISHGQHGFNFYVTNRLDWDETEISRMYSRRWDVEVWHREGKGDYGIEECQLRGDEAISRYLALSALADTLLEIASMLSPLYAMLKSQGGTPETKRRWVLLELVSRLISYASKMKDSMRHIVESIISPYRSTMKNKKGVVVV
jgi:hypothetical protein